MGPRHGSSPLPGRERCHNTGRHCQSAHRLTPSPKGLPSQGGQMQFCGCAGQTRTFPVLRESRGMWRAPDPWCPPRTCSNEVVHQGVVVISAQERAGEYDTVEWDVVLGHEVVEFNLTGSGRRSVGPGVQLHPHLHPAAASGSYLLWVLPPPLPLVGVVGCNGQVANGSIKPHIKNLGGERYMSGGHPGRCTWGQTLQPRGQTGHTLSRKPSRGTGVPHFRSRVMQRGLSPSRIQERVM